MVKLLQDKTYLDPSEWKRSLFNGKCQVILQSEKQGGEIILTATAEGVKSGSININVE